MNLMNFLSVYRKHLLGLQIQIRGMDGRMLKEWAGIHRIFQKFCRNMIKWDMQKNWLFLPLKLFSFVLQILYIRAKILIGSWVLTPNYAYLFHMEFWNISRRAVICTLRTDSLYSSVFVMKSKLLNYNWDTR